jgi:transposase
MSIDISELDRIQREYKAAEEEWIAAIRQEETLAFGERQREKGGSDKALGRSRGGLTTKIHLLCNQFGKPLQFLLTAGQVHDCTQAIALLGERKAEAVLADKGYDMDAILAHIEASGARAVIPPVCCRKQQRDYDKQLYTEPNRIERCFSKLRQFRRLATRYDKTRTRFHAFVAIACSTILLRSIVDTA